MPPTLLAVTLYVHPGREETFRLYEEKALSIGARYDCHLLHAARLSKRAEGPETPYEFHLLSLESPAALAAWRQDKEYQALSGERDACIARLETQMGDDCTLLVRPPPREDRDTAETWLSA